MKINITVKIIGVVALLFLILFIIILSNSIGNYESDLTNYFVERAKSTTYSLEAGIKNAEALQKKDELLSGIQKLMWLDPEIIDIIYVMPSKDGLVNYVSNDPQKVNLKSDPENFEAYEKKVLISSIYKKGAFRTLKIISPLHLSGQVVGTVQLDFTMENTDKKILSVISTLTMGYFMLMILFTLVLFFFLRMIIIKPIMKISKGVEAISRNELSYNVEIKSNDELGNLSKTFNNMTKELKESGRKLEDYSKSLEKQVVERTKELEKSKTELENKVHELERFTKMAVGRELKMVELKKRISELENQLREKSR